MNYPVRALDHPGGILVEQLSPSKDGYCKVRRLGTTKTFETLYERLTMPKRNAD
jgi:hypothetical protein